MHVEVLARTLVDHPLSFAVNGLQTAMVVHQCLLCFRDRHLCDLRGRNLLLSSLDGVVGSFLNCTGPEPRRLLDGRTLVSEVWGLSMNSL